MSPDPVLPHASLEVQTPSGQWEPYLAPARAVSITRGGERAGLVNSVDAGLLSVDLVDAGDPVDDPNVKPNADVRLTVETTDDQPIDLETVQIQPILGGIQDITSRDPLRITLSPGANPLFNTNMRIPTALRQHQNYSLTIDITSTGLDRATIKHEDVSEYLPHQQRTAVTFYGRARQPYPTLLINIGKTVENGFPVYVTVHNVVLTVEKIDPVYTGKIQDVATTHTRENRTFTTIVAADAVQAHANTMRFGAVVEGGGAFEPWADRVQRLAGSITTPVEVPDVNAPRVVYRYSGTDFWRLFKAPGTNPTPTPQVTQGVLSTTPEQPVAVGMLQVRTKADSLTEAYALALEYEVKSLVPGRQYTFSARGVIQVPLGDPMEIARDYALGVEGIGWGTPRTLSHVEAPRDLPAYSFTATNTAHTIRIALAQTMRGANLPVGGTMQRVAFYGMRVIELVDDPYMLQDVVYESTLLNHFDLACNSVGASWFVDRNGITQFRRWNDRPPIIANFRDEHYEIADSELVATNLIRNPAMLNGLVDAIPGAGVTLANNSRLPLRVISITGTASPTGGNSSITMRLNGSADGILGAGDWVAFAPRVRRSSGTTHARLSIGWYAGESWLGAESGPYFPLSALAPTDEVTTAPAWAAQAPAGATRAAVSIFFYSSAIGAAPAPGFLAHTTLWIASLAASRAGALRAVSRFFDGDTPPSRDLVYSWTGTPHASTSEAWTKADPLHVPYTALDLAYDTRNVVNDLAVEQHGRRLDPDQGWIADDYSLGFTDQASINQWGKRAGTLDTSLYDEGAYQGSVTSRALDLLDTNGAPARSPRSVTFNALNHTRLVARLDITDRVTVTRKGVTYTCRVVGITHEIDPTRWLVTLQLGKD